MPIHGGMRRWFAVKFCDANAWLSVVRHQATLRNIVADTTLVLPLRHGARYGVAPASAVLFSVRRIPRLNDNYRRNVGAKCRHRVVVTRPVELEEYASAINNECVAPDFTSIRMLRTQRRAAPRWGRIVDIMLSAFGECCLAFESLLRLYATSGSQRHTTPY